MDEMIERTFFSRDSLRPLPELDERTKQQIITDYTSDGLSKEAAEAEAKKILTDRYSPKKKF